MHLVLVSKSAQADGDLFTHLDELLADRRMEELQSGTLRELCEALSCRGHIRHGFSLPRRTSQKPLSAKRLRSPACSRGPGRGEWPLKTSRRQGARPRNSAASARAPGRSSRAAPSRGSDRRVRVDRRDQRHLPVRLPASARQNLGEVGGQDDGSRLRPRVPSAAQRTPRGRGTRRRPTESPACTTPLPVPPR